MLKKTGYSRGSMKRMKGENQDGENGASNFNYMNKPSGPSVVYQSKQGQFQQNLKPVKYQAPSSPSPTSKHQIAPGLVIEGEEIDL